MSFKLSLDRDWPGRVGDDPLADSIRAVAGIDSLEACGGRRSLGAMEKMVFLTAGWRNPNHLARLFNSYRLASGESLKGTA